MGLWLDDPVPKVLNEFLTPQSCKSAKSSRMLLMFRFVRKLETRCPN